MNRTFKLAPLVFTAGVSSVLAAGKPGYPDKITWNGVIWDVKTSQSAVGPGPNLFSASNVSVDATGSLHLQNRSRSRLSDVV